MDPKYQRMKIRWLYQDQMISALDQPLPSPLITSWGGTRWLNPRLQSEVRGRICSSENQGETLSSRPRPVARSVILQRAWSKTFADQMKQKLSSKKQGIAGDYVCSTVCGGRCKQEQVRLVGKIKWANCCKPNNYPSHPSTSCKDKDKDKVGELLQTQQLSFSPFYLM